MNLKVANLVAIQFGVFLGIMCWLGYSHFPGAGPRNAAITQKSTAQPATIKPGEQRSTVDYRDDGEDDQPLAEQPAPPLHEYSAAAVQHYSALAAQQYYQQIAPRRYASSGPENRSIAAVAPSYTEAEQEPAIAPAEYVAEPQTVAYFEPAQFIAYPEAFGVFSNRRRFANRCRPASDPRRARGTFAHQRRDGGRPHPDGWKEFQSPSSPAAAFGRPVNSFGVVHRRNDSTPSCQPTQGFRSHGKR